FRPERVASRRPDPATEPWPMGDVLPPGPPPPQLDSAKVGRAVDAAFEPAEAMTAAFVVTWKGRIVGERYGQGITARTPLESWSMGKSITATLMGILIRQRAYDLWQPAPVPEWQQPGDPRAKIRIADLLNMSSGLRIRAPQDRDRPLRRLPDAGIRLRCGARLGPPREPLPPGRRVERRAHSAGGVRAVREHCGSGVGGRRSPHLRRLLLDQRGRRLAHSQGRL